MPQVSSALMGSRKYLEDIANYNEQNSGFTPEQIASGSGYEAGTGGRTGYLTRNALKYGYDYGDPNADVAATTPQAPQQTIAPPAVPITPTPIAPMNKMSIGGSGETPGGNPNVPGNSSMTESAPIGGTTNPTSPLLAGNPIKAFSDNAAGMSPIGGTTNIPSMMNNPMQKKRMLSGFGGMS